MMQRYWVRARIHAPEERDALLTIPTSGLRLVHTLEPTGTKLDVSANLYGKRFVRIPKGEFRLLEIRIYPLSEERLSVGTQWNVTHGNSFVATGEIVEVFGAWNASASEPERFLSTDFSSI